ncbi:MAG: hypothetical protein IJR59_05240 [Firmicutes bacterium]|nr:hypothetical protein [Bacillota bacterium]
MDKNKSLIRTTLFVYFAVSFVAVSILPRFIPGYGYPIVVMPTILAISSAVCGALLALSDKWERIWLMPFIPFFCLLLGVIVPLLFDGLTVDAMPTLLLSTLALFCIIYIICFIPGFVAALFVKWLTGAFAKNE